MFDLGTPKGNKERDREISILQKSSLLFAYVRNLLYLCARKQKVY